MRLRQSLRKIASSFFPPGSVHIGEADTSAIAVQVADNQAEGDEKDKDTEKERDRLREFELGLERNEDEEKERGVSWYRGRRESSNKRRARNKLVKKNGQNELKNLEKDEDSSRIAPATRATSIRHSRSQSLRRSISSLKRCKSKDEALSRVLHSGTATPEPRLVSMPTPEPKQASEAQDTETSSLRGHSGHSTPTSRTLKQHSSSVRVPRRFLSKKDPKVSWHLSSPIRPGSRPSLEVTVHIDQSSRTQGSMGLRASMETNRTSTFSSFHTPKQSIHRRISCDAEPAPNTPDHLARTTPVNSTSTLRLPPSRGRNTPSLTEASSSFILRDSWCDPERVSMVMDKAGECSLREASPASGGHLEKELKPQRNAMREGGSPYVPNFSHPSSPSKDPLSSSTLQVSPEAPQPPRKFIFFHHKNASSVSLTNNTLSASSGVMDANSKSDLQPFKIPPPLDISKIQRNKHLSSSTIDSRALELWLEPASSLPTPPMSASGSGTFNRISIEKEKDWRKSNWSMAAMMPPTAEEDLTPPVSPALSRGSAKSLTLAPRSPTKREINLALLRSLSVPLPPSPVHSSTHTNFSSSSLPESFADFNSDTNILKSTKRSTRAKGKQPIYLEIPSNLLRMQRKTNGERDATKACTRFQSSYMRPLSYQPSSTLNNIFQNNDSGENDNPSQTLQPQSPRTPFSSLSPSSVKRHRKSYSAPSVSLNKPQQLSLFPPPFKLPPRPRSKFFENFNPSRPSALQPHPPPNNNSNPQLHAPNSPSSPLNPQTPPSTTPILPVRTSSVHKKKVHARSVSTPRQVHSRSVSTPWSMAPDLSAHPAFKQGVDCGCGEGGVESASVGAVGTRQSVVEL